MISTPQYKAVTQSIFQFHLCILQLLFCGELEMTFKNTSFKLQNSSFQLLVQYRTLVVTLRKGL